MARYRLFDWLLVRLGQFPELSIQQSLHQALRKAIVDGQLRPGERLPSTRALSEALGLARNTALAAFASLRAEGYVQSRHGAGSFVADVLPERFLHSRGRQRIAAARLPTRLSNRSEQWLGAEELPRRRNTGAFVPGMPDLRAFPLHDWHQLLHKHQRQAKLQHFDYCRDGGLLVLKAAIAAHLRLTRSVVSKPEQVLITSGTQQSLELCCRLLADPGDRFLIEEPGYLGARFAAQANSLQLVPLPVDDEGLRCDLLPHLPPRLIYVTPSHQYPLGSVMSLARRRTLLHYASTHGSYIIEDDYDAEFRFAGQPLAALQGLDRHSLVLYMGTFSKVLYPALRISYLVLPDELVTPFHRTQERLYGNGHASTQAALAEFIDTGRFAAHIRRMRLEYGKRDALLEHYLDGVLPSGWKLLGGGAGLQRALLAPGRVDDHEYCRRADACGLTLHPISPYYLGDESRSGFLLGFAACDGYELQRGASQLHALLR